MLIRRPVTSDMRRNTAVRREQTCATTLRSAGDEQEAPLRVLSLGTEANVFYERDCRLKPPVKKMDCKNPSRSGSGKLQPENFPTVVQLAVGSLRY